MRRIRVLVAVIAATGCGRFGFDPLCLPEAPCVVATEINRGATHALGPRLAITTRIEGNHPPFEVRIAEAAPDGNCQSRFTDDLWQPHDLESGSSFVVEPSDGLKKLCVWARDSRGATSTIVPAEGITGMNSDEILFATSNPPVVEALEVVNVVNGGRVHVEGELMRISWRVFDAEELAERPIDLDYTTEPVDVNAWMPLARDAGLTDHQMRYTDSIELPAPTALPFLVRATVRDAIGTRGIGAISEPQNTGAWNVYAGSLDRGVGAHGRAARLEGTTNSSRQFTIDPVTHDVFASDHFHGVVHVDAATGSVERLLRDGPLDLPDDGPLTADAAVPRYASLRFGPDRKLYVAPGDYTSQQTVSSTIYQIDPVTRHCRKYLGGGTQNGEGADPANVFVFPGAWDFDEDGSLYFVTSCTPGTWNAPSPSRILKATQSADGRAQTISVVAGACTTGAPTGPGPFDPLATPLGIEYPNIGTLVPLDRGRVVYFSFHPGTTRKIIDGALYSSNIMTAAAGSLAYHPGRGTLFSAEDAVVEYTPNLAGADGDLALSTHVATTGQGQCTLDGIAADRACVRAQGAMTIAGGRLYFMDGRGLNEARPYRIRFVDGSGAVQTYVGTPSFHGDGLDRRVARGMFGGIHYKPASAPNQAAFPAGLYFVEPRAPVFGSFDPSTNITRVEWGNQSGAPASHTTGTPIGRDHSLGVAYVGGNMKALAFDGTGLPWLRYGPDPSRAYLTRIDSGRRVVELQTGSTPWETTITNPRDLNLWPYGVVHNIALRESSVFVLGGYRVYNPAVVIRLLDFKAGSTTHIMGATPNGYTASATAGNVKTSTISASCAEDFLNCYVHYRAADNRLYFSEDTRMRYITEPSNPAVSTLATLWANPTASINNFIFREDGSQVLYLSRGVLRCHDLSSGRSWCNDSSLGPPAILEQIINGPDQLTWKDARTLLISTHRGQILEYTLPP